MSELDPQQLPPDDQRELADIAQTELETELEQLEALRAQPNILTFSRIFANVPKLPGAAIVEQTFGRPISAIGPFFRGDTLHQAQAAVHTAHGMLQGLGKKGGTAAETTEISYARVRRTLGPAKLDVFVRELGRLRGAYGDDLEYHLLPLAPLVLLHIAADALTQDSVAARLERGAANERTQAEIDAEVSVRLKTACLTLVNGQKLKIQGFDTNATVVTEGALKLLDQCGSIGASAADRRELVYAITPLFYSQTFRVNRSLSLPEMRAAFNNCVEALQAFGIHMAAPGGEPYHLPDAELVRIYKQEVDDPRPGRAKNMAYAKLGAYHYADRLIAAIATGELDYVQVINAVATISSTPLATLIARRAAEEEAKRISEEEVRLREASRLQALGWQPLRPTDRQSDTNMPQLDEEDRQQVKGKRQKRTLELDAYRLAALEDIKDMFPGAEIWHRPLKTGRKAPEDHRKDNSDGPEEYCVLIIPRKLADGRVVYDAIAECAEVGTAAYLWLAEWGMDASGQVVITWETVFDNNRPAAQKYGAVDMRHPRRSERMRNPAKAAGRFRGRLLDALTAPFEGSSALVDRQETSFVLRIGQREVGGVLNFVGIRGLARRLAAIDESRPR